MGKSVLVEDMEHCFICGKMPVELHHCLHGTANRKKADKYKYIVPLCREHHTGNYGAHQDKTLDLFFKQMAQKHFEKHIGTRDDFRAVFGKSWL